MADEPRRYQETSAGGDAYVAGRDMHIHNLPSPKPQSPAAHSPAEPNPPRNTLATWLRRLWRPRRSSLPGTAWARRTLLAGQVACCR